MNRIHKIVAPFLMTAVFFLLIAGCSQSRLPPELGLTQVAYQTDDIHFSGPGGINQSFIVFQLRQEVAATIADKGLSYLNSLPTDGRNSPPTTGPWWGPFVDWRMTPVPSEKAWLRRGRDLEKDWKPSLTTFYVSFKGDDGKNSFISKIPPEYAEAFHQALATPGNFYAYGDYRGMCLIVLSPRTGQAFYLFRD